MKKLTSLALFMLINYPLMCQSFTKGNNLGGLNFINGATAWGDYDNDGDMDLVLIGTPGGTAVTKFYVNNNNGTFSEKLNHGFRNVGDGDLEWEDYNNDGNLDLLISGNDNTAGGFGTTVTRLYKNLGNGSFLELAGNFLNAFQGSVEWMDFDNDNKPDFLVTGRTDPQGTSNSIALYKNMGGDNFAAVTTPFESLAQSDVEAADFDNDGYLDIAMAGLTEPSGLTNIYKNNGNGTFSLHQQLPTAMRASLVAGDYNNDGYLDLVISGFSGASETLKVYKNVNGTFTPVNSSTFVGGEQGSTGWVDYDNDGNLDIISSVIGDGIWGTRIYKNTGNDSFVLEPNPGLPGNDYSKISYIDVEKDGDLDIFFPSTFNSNNAMYFYTNSSSKANIAPTPPVLNSEVINGSQATISWGASADSGAPQATLTYNIFVTYNSDTVVNPNSIKSGRRKYAKGGNRQYQRSYVISNLTPGDYQWSAQAVDNSFNASGFAITKSFHINYPPVLTGVRNAVSTNEDTPLVISASNFIINDPDNIFPGDFEVKIQAGNNYTFSGNVLTPALNYSGSLTVPIVVSDGKDQSAIFNLSVTVLPVNDRPVITGIKNPLTTPEETPIAISLDNINVQDPDNTYPNGFSIAITAGTNYAVADNTVTPIQGFVGLLNVPITVNDGTTSSEPFIVSIEVTKIIGLGEHQLSGVNVYPNPATDFAFVSVPQTPSTIELVNALSKPVAIPMDLNFESNLIRLDFASLPKGFYILIVYFEDKVTKQRLLIN